MSIRLPSRLHAHSTFFPGLDCPSQRALRRQRPGRAQGLAFTAPSRSLPAAPHAHRVLSRPRRACTRGKPLPGQPRVCGAEERADSAQAAVSGRSRTKASTPEVSAGGQRPWKTGQRRMGCSSSLGTAGLAGVAWEPVLRSERSLFPGKVGRPVSGSGADARYQRGGYLGDWQDSLDCVGTEFLWGDPWRPTLPRAWECVGGEAGHCLL